tara:strand:- start:55 stop:453 length:399 start_codon:yes stop_codon:yes gene_type:complete
MPYTIDVHENGIFVRYFGFVSPADFIEAQKVLHNHPHHDLNKFVLCDFLDLDPDCIWAMTISTTDQVGEHDIKADVNRNNLKKLALVTDSEKVRELCQYYTERYVPAPNVEIQMFRTVPQAWAWIRSDPDCA